MMSDLLSVIFFFFFSSRRRHTRSLCDWSSDVCSSDLVFPEPGRMGAALGLLRLYRRSGLQRLVRSTRALRLFPRLAAMRSEERRVGKECSSRWWAEP